VQYFLHTGDEVDDCRSCSWLAAVPEDVEVVLGDCDSLGVEQEAQYKLLAGREAEIASCEAARTETPLDVLAVSDVKTQERRSKLRTCLHDAADLLEDRRITQEHAEGDSQHMRVRKCTCLCARARSHVCMCERARVHTFACARRQEEHDTEQDDVDQFFATIDKEMGSTVLKEGRRHATPPLQCARLRTTMELETMQGEDATGYARNTAGPFEAACHVQLMA